MTSFREVEGPIGASRPLVVVVPGGPELRARLERECARARQLRVEGVAAVLESHESASGVQVLLERPSGTSLRTLLGRRRLPVDEILSVAIGLVEILVRLHRCSAVHGGLRPDDVWVSTAGEVSLSAPALPVLLELAFARPNEPAFVKTILPYLSPEQTTRTAQQVDTRSDLYAVGAILYELLAGRPPFTFDEPLELIHAHLARTPDSLAMPPTAVQGPLEQLVIKLLAKAPEQRYQTASGLLDDLRRCHDAHAGALSPADVLPLARHDRPSLLQLPHALYGRAAERVQLRDAFERVCGSARAELVVVEGAPGVGKTALIRDLRAPVAAKRGHFLFGKFSQLNRGAACSAIVEAFGGLVQQLLTEPDERVREWQDRIQQAVGQSGRVLVEVIPELELIIGPQPPVVALEPEQSRNRLAHTFRALVKACAVAEHPLVLFLDDLQWVDTATLNLLEALSGDPGSQYLLLVVAYRDREVGPEHIARVTLDRIRRSALPTDTIAVAPLSMVDVAAFVADTVRAGSEAVSEVAHVVHDKTRGNPFFMRAFLGELTERGLLGVDADGGWRWDRAGVQALPASENVVDLLVSRLSHLAPETRECLMRAAAFGSAFDLRTLSVLTGSAPGVALEHLAPAQDAGLLIHTGGAQRFVHDRVQEAAYSLIPEGERTAVHWDLGRRLLEGLSPSERQARLFEVVDNLNHGLQLPLDPAARVELARLNLTAACKAKQSAAYEAAGRYFGAGVQALGEERWQSEYALMAELQLGVAESAYLGGQVEVGEQLFRTLLDRIATLPERARLYHFAVRQLNYQSLHVEAIERGLEGLRGIGIDLAVTDPAAMIAAIDAVETLLSERSLSEVMSTPEHPDPLHEAAMLLLMDLVPMAHIVGPPPMLPLVAATMVLRSVQHGFVEQSPMAFSVYGVCLGLLGRGFRHGLRYCDAAMEAFDRGIGRSTPGIIEFFVTSFMNHWCHPVREGLPLIERAIEALVPIDPLFTGYCRGTRVYVVYGMGESLPALLETSIEESRHLQRAKHPTQSIAQAMERFARGLMGEGTDVAARESPALELAFDETLQTHGLPPGVYVHRLGMLIRSYLADCPRQALDWSRRAQELEGTTAGALTVVDRHLYHGLTLARLLTPSGSFADADEKLAGLDTESLRAELDGIASVMKTWVADSPDNFEPLHQLLAGELARLGGRDAEAAGAYTVAVDGARRLGHVHYEALVHDVAGRFWMERGQDGPGRVHLEEAARLWNRFGATRRVHCLEQRHPLLRPLTTESRRALEGRRGTLLDLASILEVSRAITEEVERGGVVRALLVAAIENAGAQRGVMVGLHGDVFHVEAEASIAKAPRLHRPPIPLADAEDLLPVAAVRFALRTGHPLALTDAFHEGDFRDDPYVQRTQARSVLCFPIRKQRRTFALLHLENHLASRVFSADRLEVLHHLCAQAATALENAQLYTELRESEERYRTTFEQAADPILLVEPGTGKLFDFNQSAARALGYEREELLGKRLADLVVAEGPPKDWLVEGVAPDRAFESKLQTKQGASRDVEVSARLMSLSGGRVLLFVARDVTERNRLEAQLVQSQKMEAMGRLAGGVAHDINNALTGILGYADLIIEESGHGSLIHSWSQEIAKGCEHATSFTRQLLAFSRPQMFKAQPVRLNDVVENMRGMLRSLVGARVTLVTRLSPEVGAVMADPGMLGQVILNLAINARDAMPSGGTLTLETAVARTDPRSRTPGDAPGQFVLTVTDTGVGMDETLQQRIFEPFFTTKGSSQGTGLGLAVTHGVIQRFGGRIEVFSMPGKGTQMTVVLPQAASEGVPAPASTRLRPPSGRGTILLVEDQETARGAISRMLQSLGYDVLEASDVLEAYRIDGARGDAVDLLVTDVVMPGGSGVDMARTLQRRRPRMAVLCMSGHADSAGLGRIADEGFAFIAKPFSYNALGHEVSKVLRQ